MIKTLEQRHDLVLVFLSLTLNTQLPAGRVPDVSGLHKVLDKILHDRYLTVL